MPRWPRTTESLIQDGHRRDAALGHTDSGDGASATCRCPTSGPASRENAYLVMLYTAAIVREPSTRCDRQLLDVTRSPNPHPGLSASASISAWEPGWLRLKQTKVVFTEILRRCAELPDPRRYENAVPRHCCERSPDLPILLQPEQFRGRWFDAGFPAGTETRARDCGKLLGRPASLRRRRGMHGMGFETRYAAGTGSVVSCVEGGSTRYRSTSAPHE